MHGSLTALAAACTLLHSGAALSPFDPGDTKQLQAFAYSAPALVGGREGVLGERDDSQKERAPHNSQHIAPEHCPASSLITWHSESFKTSNPLNSVACFERLAIGLAPHHPCYLTYCQIQHSQEELGRQEFAQTNLRPVSRDSPTLAHLCP